MKYTVEILVRIPLQDFVKKLQNPENLKHWQRGFVSYDVISGYPGDVGSKMKLVYKIGKRDMELLETVIHKQEPNELHVMYDTDGMQNIQENSFEETPKSFTKWTVICEFLPMNFMLRMMTILMPGTFKKQSKQYMQDFKNFAEKGISINHEKA